MSERPALSFRVAEAVEGRLRRRLTPEGLRRAYRLGYLVLRPWWFVSRPRTSGVKVVVRCGDDVLLIRHTYARRDQWDLPGGFVAPGEDPEEALRRELLEELRVAPVAVISTGTTPSRRDRKREVLHSYAVEIDGRAITPNPAEIAEARWVHREALPEDTSPFTRRMVARAYWEYWTDPPDEL
ncbi:MAG TPA: NUDIX domain-containing protein [Baekduia sp.]|nr:NUDIX domain-containing protein [Baekduia sp.]